jgi:uncharacterized protein YecE (DUF72 family)
VHRQWPEQHGVEDAEQRNVKPDPDCQSRNRNDREAWLLENGSEGISHKGPDPNLQSHFAANEMGRYNLLQSKELLELGSGPVSPVCPEPVIGCPSTGPTDTLRAVSERVLVGTSGYNYPEWRGSFYPEKFSTDKMLAYYAERFTTVEINYTFYRMPTKKLLAGWAAGTPDGFTFTLKAPRRITHDAKLQRCEDTLQVFCRTARTLGSKLGVLLFQLPPNFKKDVAVLRSFVELLPDATRAAFEFRHPSWFEADVFDALRSRNVALCIADSEKLSTPVESTADYAYFRLRDEGYQQDDIVKWAAVVKALPASDAFVYFKHEEQGLGPDFARRFIAALPQS